MVVSHGGRVSLAETEVWVLKGGVRAWLMPERGGLDRLGKILKLEQ